MRTKLSKFTEKFVEVSVYFIFGKFNSRDSAKIGQSKEEGKSINNAGDMPVTPRKPMARGRLTWQRQARRSSLSSKSPRVSHRVSVSLC